ncbi:MAG: ABC transporter permease [Acidobacteria bacterium]|nr:ABC transporter permease [Acidobacteriota bacterium]
MNFVAWQMLTGDRAKYAGLVLAIAFSTFLMSHQMSIFVGLLNRTQSQIKDITDAGIWVMDPKTEYLDEVRALSNQDLYRVRGVEGIQWAVPLFKGNARVKASDGQFRNTILLGLDDTTLVGLPRIFLAGDWRALRYVDTVAIDEVGFRRFFPGQAYSTGHRLDIGDKTVTIGAVVRVSPPFVNLPVVYARYSEAIKMVGRESRQLSFILCESKPGIAPEELCTGISAATGLKAETAVQFGWDTIWYYIRNTGIPINFGITITIALLVGALVSGQTFSLFILENLKYFGALKAIGVTTIRIILMIFLQAIIVLCIGYALGISMTAAFFEFTKDNLELRGFRLLPEIMLLTGALVTMVVLIATMISVRRVAVVEPAIVFRG